MRRRTPTGSRSGAALRWSSIAAIDEPIDLCFIDADKEGYTDYYEAVVPKLSDHGLIAADNTLRAGRVLEGESWTSSTATSPRTRAPRRCCSPCATGDAHPPRITAALD